MLPRKKSGQFEGKIWRYHPLPAPDEACRARRFAHRRHQAGAWTLIKGAAADPTRLPAARPAAAVSGSRQNGSAAGGSSGHGPWCRLLAVPGSSAKGSGHRLPPTTQGPGSAHCMGCPILSGAHTERVVPQAELRCAGPVCKACGRTRTAADLLARTPDAASFFTSNAEKWLLALKNRP